ncbi:hypothetical protein J2D73_10455 [Acetobacter sacchari]|uniref:Uncharacterized protein n=1 Tax=Acetobacter sacchari TaxID=2661687 RepID=A0ABS3LWC5_9PROT|nr:hypothetical protein [Acetobacter sacchari]MBO1360214.1 hypothetical protein [Acetobacter sacchari]
MVAAKATARNFHLTLSGIVLIHCEHAMMLYSMMLVKWASVRLTREDARALKTRTIEDAQTCPSAFLMRLDTMHGVPRLNLLAAEGVGRQNYQF